MSFADELAKLQRVRRGYVKFVAPGGAERCYGKAADPSGPIPVKGTVESFGSFSSAVANAEFPIEIPSNQTTLTDPDREWRALGDRPSMQLLQQPLEYYLRQETDTEDVLDVLIAVGQIANPRFPPGKCTLALNVPGGDFLGERVGRRLLTDADWPYALPDDRGKVIPFVYGRLVNTPPETVEVITTSPGSTTGGGTGSGGGSQACNCTVGGWSGSPSLVFFDNFDGYADQTAFNQNWNPAQNGLTTERSFSGTTSMGDRQGWFTRGIPAVSGAGNVYFFGLQIFWTGSAPGFGLLASLEAVSFFNGFNTQCSIGCTNGGELYVTGATGTLAITDPGKLQINQWNCVTAMLEADNPGLFKVFCNGTLVLEGSGNLIARGKNTDGSVSVRGFTVGSVINQYVDDVWFARGTQASSASTYCNGGTQPVDPTAPTIIAPVTTTTFLCPDVTTNSGDSNSATRGGWLRALLVDAGSGSPVISDLPVPGGTSGGVSAGLAGQPHAAPTIGASLQAGGNGAPGSVNYYACCTMHNGVMSNLSNVVGPVTPDDTNRQVQLTFSGLAAGADHVRLFRGTDPGFVGTFSRYRVTGYQGAVSDLSAGSGGVMDEYPGLNIGDQVTPDTHWDTEWRKQVYYQVSARFADGTESACSEAVMVSLTPRNGPLDVNVSWTAPSSPVSPVSEIVVRRSSQTHHWGIGLDREWDLAPAATSLVDALTDTTPASPCATANIPSGGTGTPSPVNRNRYVLAGHTLKAIHDVFVLKPDPAIVDSTGVPNGTPIQVRMVPGVDYYDEVVEINGNRYHTLVFNQPQRSSTCEFYEVTANVSGVDYNADGSGELMVNADDIFEHIMLNVILNTYRSSVGLYAPSGGRWFTDVPYSPGLFNHDSVVAAKAVGEILIPDGGLKGSGALTELIGTRELIYQLLVSYGLTLYQFNGVWYTQRFNPRGVVRGSLINISPDEGIEADSFEPHIEQERHVNAIPYFAGPLGGGSETDGFLVASEHRNSESIELYGRVIITDPMYLYWTQDAATALAVVSGYLYQVRYPPISATFNGPMRWWGIPVGSVFTVTHPEGLGSTGWVNRVCRLLKIELNLDDMTTTLTVRDIDDLVP